MKGRTNASGGGRIKYFKVNLTGNDLTVGNYSSSIDIQTVKNKIGLTNIYLVRFVLQHKYTDLGETITSTSIYSYLPNMIETGVRAVVQVKKTSNNVYSTISEVFKEKYTVSSDNSVSNTYVIGTYRKTSTELATLYVEGYGE